MILHADGIIFAVSPLGGISRYFTNLLNALDSRDDVETILYLPPSARVPEELAPIRIIRTPSAVRLKPRQVFDPLNARLNAARQQRFWSRARGGVFHSSFYTSPAGLRVPQVVTVHDMIYEDYPGIFFPERSGRKERLVVEMNRRHVAAKRRSFERAAGIIYSSNFARRRTEAHLGADDRPVLVAPFAIDPVFRGEPRPDEISAFRALIGTDEPFLLHTGSRRLHKNFVALLAAFATWSRRNELRLVSVGGGELSGEEQAIVTGLGLDERVMVVAAVPNHLLRAAYHAAEALVFPSLTEGFGFPVLEAFACGCPVACARAGSLPEVGGSHPVYFEPSEPDDVRRALDEILSVRSDSERWGAAREAARERTWDDVAAEYVDFYTEIIDRRE